MSLLATNINLASDRTLRPFLAPSFDPADFLNATLPTWTPSATTRQPHSVSLVELSNQTQTLLSQLNAQINRLSATLTQLTDEILRSGGRLAYDVEVLRADTLSLTDALSNGLKEDIEKFVPEGLQHALETKHRSGSHDASRRLSVLPTVITDVPDDETQDHKSLGQKATPEYIEHLRTLTTVRNRLESVIKVFGDAMAWTLPPSEVSVKSSFISISAPEPDTNNESQETKGREYTEKLYAEISDIMESAASGGEGVSTALQRVDAIRTLAVVWKGTAEEKARLKVVENLARVIQDKQKHGNGGYQYTT